jgi:hypothetical protein
MKYLHPHLFAKHEANGPKAARRASRRSGESAPKSEKPCRPEFTATPENSSTGDEMNTGYRSIERAAGHVAKDNSLVGALQPLRAAGQPRIRGQLWQLTTAFHSEKV